MQYIHCSLVSWWILNWGSQLLKFSEKSAMVFAPHQDDETFGCGGMIARKKEQGIPVAIAFLTDGRGSHGLDTDAQNLIHIRQQESLTTEIFQYPIWIFWRSPLFILLKLQDIAAAYRFSITSVKEKKQRAINNRIHFEGFQPEPQRYMLATDIFVLASHCESFGLVLTEAREAGCAIIASNVDGIPETLDHSQAGILIPPKDIDTLTNTLTQLLSDRQLLNKWKFRAQQNLARFHAARVNEETLAVYRELMRKSNVIEVMEIRKLVTGK
jgi:glycosyltransferase involved in cell wall biosynthesis